MIHPCTTLVSGIYTLPESVRLELARFDPSRLVSKVHEIGPVIAAKLRSDPRVKAILDRIEANARYMEEIGCRRRAHLAQQTAVTMAAPASAKPTKAKAMNGGKQ